MNEVGNIIKNARISKKISQEELANKLGVTRQAISNWENNKNLPDIMIIFTLCKELDINEDNSLNNNEQIIKSEKRKIKKKTIIICIFIIILFLFIISLLFLVIKRNQFEVYNISLDSEKFKITNGIFIKSKINNYLLIDSIDTNEQIYSVKIYSLTDKKENLIFETESGDYIIINEGYGYSEYFSDIDEDYENLYIEILTITNNNINKYDYQLKLDVIMKSKSLLYLKNDRISETEDNNLETDKDEIMDLQDNLFSNGYEYESNQSRFVKNNEDNSNFYYSSFSNVLSYSQIIDENIISIKYYINNNYIEGRLYSKEKSKYTMEYYYFLDNNEAEKFSCFFGECDNYEKYNKFILEEWNSIMGKSNLTKGASKTCF